jgi:hypothetical protein
VEQLTCAWCILKNRFKSDKQAVTLFDGIAFCRDHLLEYERAAR